MIVLEDCPRCGEVATHVADDDFERREARDARLAAAGVRLPDLRYHWCKPLGLEHPIKLRPRWLAWLLRWFS